MSCCIDEGRKDNKVHKEIPTFQSDTVLALTRSQGRKATKTVSDEMYEDDVNDELDAVDLFRKYGKHSQKKKAGKPQWK